MSRPHEGADHPRGIIEDARRAISIGVVCDICLDEFTAEDWGDTQFEMHAHAIAKHPDDTWLCFTIAFGNDMDFVDIARGRLELLQVRRLEYWDRRIAGQQALAA